MRGGGDTKELDSPSSIGLGLLTTNSSTAAAVISSTGKQATAEAAPNSSISDFASRPCAQVRGNNSQQGMSGDSNFGRRQSQL